jgi:hypothetical protein
MHGPPVSNSPHLPQIRGGLQGRHQVRHSFQRLPQAIGNAPKTPLALQNEVVWCCLPVTTTMSPEAIHDPSIPDPLHVLNEKLDLECTRLRETRLSPELSTASLE